ncbi:S-adenosyl-L-methionine-dependent methyltransferase [Melampsora americana]|nr:S-adenosyl-L-methionine-dependent methyltransferase [Melampsora americana]
MANSGLPPDNESYGSAAYWDERYSQEPAGSHFDWFQSYSELSDLIHQHVPLPEAKICVLGCGNSTLSQDMYEAGYHSVVNVDVSQVLVERMRTEHPKMTWVQADVRELPFESASFDVAIDKGTMDALMCSKGDVWEPSEEVIENCKREVDEVVRILKPGGVFLYITFGQPHFRKRHLERPGIWSVETTEIGNMFHYYFYSMRKEESHGAASGA